MLPHELRTPLNGILAYGEILKTDAATLSHGELTEMGQVIQQSGQRLQRLIENFLIYAQLELMAGDPQSTQALRSRQTPQPARVIQKCAQNQAETVRRLADLKLDLPGKAVGMSEQYLEKITDELVNNALKFSQPGTPVRVSLSPAGKWVNLSIADHGRGMTQEQIAGVGAYMQFQRKVQEQQGLGLGLIISKRLAELHGGALAIQSEPGKGTTVTVNLPPAG
jgi:signal transduction histidine kinase